MGSADKEAEFRRINGPRVQRAVDQIALVEKSATSMRISDEELETILLPVDNQLADILGDKSEETPGPDEEQPAIGQDPAPLEATQPVAREMARLSDLSTQQLVDRMIACGAELAKRRQ